MKEEALIEQINKCLEVRLQGVTSFNQNEGSFIGYNPIEKIRGGLFHWISVPFNGTGIFCQLRCPNQTQIEQCGDISTITREKLENNQCDYEELIKLRNYQENICRMTFNIPTFDHIAELVGRDDFVISEKKKELAELDQKFEDNKDSMSEVEKKVLETKIKTIELQIGFILPTDTMDFVTWWAMGNDISDIKKITKENFLRAAALAKAHNKAPSDYISGVFTDHNRKDIDAYAAQVLNDYMEEKKAVDGKFKWFKFGKD